MVAPHYFEEVYMLRKITIAILAVLVAASVAGCSKAEQKSIEISRDANEFNVERRITVINTRTGTILWQLTGTFSTQSKDGDLDVIVALGDNRFAKHYFDLNDWTTYVVEDMSNENLPDHYYEMKFLPGGGK